MILERASGNPVYQLDLWMVGEAACRQLLYDAADEADLILIEGVMGLFDGEPSSADLARAFGVPVLAVVDAGAMAQTFGALAHGLASYRPDVPFAGVLANRVASPNPRPDAGAIHATGTSLFRRARAQPGDATAGPALGISAGAGNCRSGGTSPGRRQGHRRNQSHGAARAGRLRAGYPAGAAGLLAGVRIGVARDTAFAFLYRKNIDLLRAMGAELCFSRRWPTPRCQTWTVFIFLVAIPSCTSNACKPTVR